MWTRDRIIAIKQSNLLYAISKTKIKNISYRKIEDFQILKSMLLFYGSMSTIQIQFLLTKIERKCEIKEILNRIIAINDRFWKQLWNNWNK